jgi:hypothetical protein
MIVARMLVVLGLLCTPALGWTEPSLTVVPELVLPERPEMAREEVEQEKQEVLRLLGEVERGFPKTGRMKKTVEVWDMELDERLNRESMEYVFAHQADGARFYHYIEEDAKKRLDVTHNMKATRELLRVKTADDGEVYRGTVIDLTAHDDYTSFMHDNGLRFMTPFHLSGSLYKTLATPGQMGGEAWEVLDLTAERLVVRLFTTVHHSVVVELDLTRGGNLVRYEEWIYWGQPKAKKASCLQEYELVEVEGRWMPARYDVVAPGGQVVLFRHEFQWSELDKEIKPEEFFIQFPPNAETEDETTVAAKASRMKDAMNQRVQSLLLSRFFNFLN